MTREHDLAVIGAGLLDAGYATTDAGAVVRRIAARDGEVMVGVLPAAVVVDAPAAARPAIVPTSGRSLTFAHVGRIARLAADAERGAPLPETARLIALETATTIHTPWWRGAAGGALMSGGVAVVFGVPAWAVIPDAALGALVGMTLLVAGRGLAAVLPFVSALVSALVLGALATALGQDSVAVFAVCAPIVMLIPGATVTNAVLEITGGDVVSGGGRLLSGLLLWATLAGGVAAGVLLVQGVHPVTLTATAGDPVPAILTWPAIIVLGVGVCVFFAAPFTMGLAVTGGLVVAFAVSSLLTPVTGAFVATSVTAALLLIAARLLERIRPELPAIVTFRPTFWLLVPGSLGLASLARADPAGLVTVATTVLAIMLGVLVGSAVTLGMLRATPR